MVKNLKTLRTQKGISQQALAVAIGISQQSINKYENHNIEPDIATLIALADYFDTTVDYLIGRTGQNGNNVNLLDGDEWPRQYQKLGDQEKACINIIIDTFRNIKAK